MRDKSLRETTSHSDETPHSISQFDSLKNKIASTFFTFIENLPEVPVTRNEKKYFSITCLYFIIKSQNDSEFCRSYYDLLKQWEQKPYSVKQKNVSAIKSEAGWTFLIDESYVFRTPEPKKKDSKKINKTLNYISELKSKK